MATRNEEVYKKFRQFSLRQEADGTEVEVREDEEQGIKLQEIVDLLVAAGYFRARIKGLSAFDKIVGGMVWCIESCNVDVDVDLLFQENSTIGQKIALTEIIVAVLPKLKCPHAIEPHQIQGLDFIHIFPVIQWLVKKSMEHRQEVSTFVRSYAINQFHKDFQNDTKQQGTSRQKAVLSNIQKVNEFYRPRRRFKCKTSPPKEIDSQVQVTLLEYGMNRNKLTASKSTDNDELEEEEEQFNRLLNVMAEINDTDSFLYDELKPEERDKLTKHYMALHGEIKDGGVKSREMQRMTILNKQKQALITHMEGLNEQRTLLGKQIEKESCKFSELKSKLDETNQSIKELDESVDNSSENVKRVEDLVILNENIKTKELRFREYCKKEKINLQNLIEETKKAKTPVLNEDEHEKEYLEHNEKLKTLKLQTAKKTRSIAVLQRQIDNLPSRAELAQYQKRFLELYNQVGSKHKETKQYYTLYNTLEDTRRYMKTEISLLNSISDSYPIAMQSNGGKEEFLKQFQSILESVRRSKEKVDKRLREEKQNRDLLTFELQRLMDLQRKYATAIKQLSIECKKHETKLKEEQ